MAHLDNSIKYWFARKYRSQSKTNEGAWISVEPEPGTLVINIGDMMQNFTNGQVLAFFYSLKNDSNSFNFKNGKTPNKK